ncbi:MAG: hypothetical protein QOC82_1951 [Frankiaceae bacterium]|nr:hypothetical protein [Frankiaceae bacterium]
MPARGRKIFTTSVRLRGLRLRLIPWLVVASVGAQGLAAGTASADVPPPWAGSVSLSTDRAQTDANSPYATLTATVSSALRDNLSVSIYDDTGARITCSSYTGTTTFTASVAPANNATRGYSAYVAQDCPPSSYPTTDVRSGSGGVTVHNLGWTGSVALTTSTAQTNANSPYATLTATLSKTLASPYQFSIYDDTGARITCSSYTGTTTFTASVAPGNNASRSYTAYVAQDCPASGTPVLDVRSTSGVTVQNLGWTGSVSLATSRAQTDANSPYATLTATLSKTLASPYQFSIYDDLGARITCTTYTGTTTFTASVAPANLATRTYTAYVSQDCPASGAPALDVRSTSSATVQSAGWTGSVSMTTSQAQTDANTPYATLTATLSKTLASPYQFSIYDDTGSRITCTSYTGTTTFTASVAPGNNASRSYTAYVAQDCPASGVPVVDVRSTSAAVVQNMGWTGSVSLTTSRAQTDANNPYATLTATLSKTLASPYQFSIYDDTGARITCTTYTGTTTFTASVAPGNNTTRTYTAYVAQDCPASGHPVTDVRSTTSVAVQNAGWTGSVSMTTSRAQTDANNPYATLTATLSKTLASPYQFSIYDDLGSRITCTTYTGTTTFTASVAPANNTTRTYTAYVAQDCPASGYPVADVRSTTSVTVQNLGWTGSVSLTTSAAQTDANNPYATLTATLSKTLASPYQFSIYDDLGSRITCTTYTGTTTFTASVAPGTHTSRTYTAYVALDCPTSSPPANPAAQTGGVTVTNVGYNGSLSLTTDRSETSPSSPNATLTATLSKNLAGSYQLSIYDDTGSRLTCSGYTGTTTFTASATPPTDTSRVYTAYVAPDCPPSGGPQGTIDAMATVGVTNVAPTGAAIGVSVNTWQHDSTGTTVSYDVLVTGSYLSAADGPCRSSSCNWTLTGRSADGQSVVLGSGSLAAGATSLATSVSQQGATLPTISSLDVAMVGSGTTLAETVGVDTTVIGAISVDDFVAWMAARGVTEDEFCLYVAEAPQPRPNSSLGTFGEACEAASTLQQALIAVAGLAGGSATLWYIWTHYFAGTTPSAPPAAPPTTPPTDPNPPSTPTTTVPTVTPQMELQAQVDHLVGVWKTRKRLRSMTTDSNLETAAWQCLDMVSRSAPLIKAWSSTGQNPCETRPIYFPGSDLPATTQHRADAIYTQNPDWAFLTYEASAIKRNYVPRAWYANQQDCATASAPTTSCDEFPNYSSVEGGPAKPGVRVRASLKVLASDQNSAEGSRYGGFVTSCGLKSATDDSGASGGDNFLVIPLAFSGAPPTGWICSIPM